MEFAQDVANMVLHRLLRDEQLNADLTIRVAAGNKVEDLALAIGQYGIEQNSTDSQAARTSRSRGRSRLAVRRWPHVPAASAASPVVSSSAEYPRSCSLNRRRYCAAHWSPRSGASHCVGVPLRRDEV